MRDSLKGSAVRLIQLVYETHQGGGGALPWESLKGALAGVATPGWVELAPRNLAIQFAPSHEVGGRFQLSGGPLSFGADGWRVEAPSPVEGLYVSFETSLSLHFDEVRTLRYQLGVVVLPLKKFALDRFRLRVSFVGRSEGFFFSLLG
jgi:hypothetical protein